MNKGFAKLGRPGLKLAGLKIWVHGRESDDSQDYWDGNWLRVTVHCADMGASVFATGSIIHLAELYGWRSQAEDMLNNLGAEATLNCMEPELSVELKSISPDHISMEVSITPSHLSQRHWFQFDIDQSFLPGLISECQAILKAYPIRGSL